MRLFLALFLLSGNAWSVCAPGYIRYWILPGGTNVTEECIGDSITLNGTIAANAVTCGVYSSAAGSFTNTNRYTGSQAFMDAFEAVTVFSMEFYLYLVSAPTLDGIVRWDGTPTATEVHVSSSGADPATLGFRQFSGAWTGISTGAVIATGACYNIAITHNGTVGKIYVDGVEKGSGTFGSVATDITAFKVGTDGGTAFTHGYLTGLKVSNIVRTSFPTGNPVVQNTVRGMKLRKIMRMNQ